jgi:glycosyltransferase involved in cell wall biosynthesis
MRILFTVDRVAPGGGREMSVLELSRELAHRGHEIDLFYAVDGALQQEYRAFCHSLTKGNLEFARVHWARDLARLSPLVLAGARHRPDVVFAQRFKDIVFCALTGRLRAAPVVCHLHGFVPYTSVPEVGSLVTRFIAVSDDTRRKWVTAGLDPDRIDVVHNGIDAVDYPFGGDEELRWARAELGIPADCFTVLYCGRPDKEKGVDVLLDAWRTLDLDPDQARLVLLGDPILDIDNAEILRAKAPPGCQWLPTRRKVAEVMHAADVVVLPSRSEGFGRVLIEAMATGRPAVAARVGGTPEVLAGPFARFLFEAGNPEDLAAHLTSLMHWRRDDPTLGPQCTTYALTHFSLAATADGVEAVLRRAVEEGSRPLSGALRRSRSVG